MTTAPLPMTVTDADCTPQVEAHAIGTEVAGAVAAPLQARAAPRRRRGLAGVAAAAAGAAARRPGGARAKLPRWRS